MLIRVAVLLLASVLLAPTASAEPRPIDLLPGYHFFSPNGDASKDRVPVRFLLRERADVSVLVRSRGDGTVIRRVHLGSLGTGRHAWRWDGRTDRGRAAGNGYYKVRVTAVAGSRTGVATMSVGLDRGERLRRARVWLSRDTVYPATPDFEDRIHIRATDGGFDTELAIRDADGHVVRRTGVHGWASWAGRDDAGAALPPGEYDARFTIEDHYGNQRTTHRTLTISDQPLHAEVWSTTVRAVDAELLLGDTECAPTPSERYDGGLTVADADGCRVGMFRPRTELPFTIDPSASWRVSVTGSGGAGAGSISLFADPSQPDTPTLAGDATTTTPWGDVPDYAWALPPDWVFRLAAADPPYDVASFTLEVRRWVP